MLLQTNKQHNRQSGGDWASANGFKEQPNFYLTTLNDEAAVGDEDDDRPSMETLDRKIPNPFEVRHPFSKA